MGGGGHNERGEKGEVAIGEGDEANVRTGEGGGVEAIVRETIFILIFLSFIFFSFKPTVLRTSVCQGLIREVQSFFVRTKLLCCYHYKCFQNQCDVFYENSFVVSARIPSF